MSAPWPPPPDIESIQQLVAEADVEGFIADGAHTDEYEAEAEMLFQQIEGFATGDIIEANLMPIAEAVWVRAFNLDAEDVAERREKLIGLTRQIARFFGPEARPQVRGAGR